MVDYTNTTLLHCDFCGVLMGYKETATSEYRYTNQHILAGEIIVDGTFELGNLSIDWSPYGSSGIAVVTTEDKHSGSYSAKLPSYTSGISQALSVNLNILISVGFWYKGHGLYIGIGYANTLYTDLLPDVDIWTYYDALADIKANIPLDSVITFIIFQNTSSDTIDYVDDVSIPTSIINTVSVHLCYEDRMFVTIANLAVTGQLAIDKATRNIAFEAYILTAINPETSDEVNYPWY